MPAKLWMGFGCSTTQLLWMRKREKSRQRFKRIMCWKHTKWTQAYTPKNAFKFLLSLLLSFLFIFILNLNMWRTHYAYQLIILWMKGRINIKFNSCKCSLAGIFQTNKEYSTKQAAYITENVFVFHLLRQKSHKVLQK